MKALTDYMTLLEINQDELARRIKVSPSQLNHWLTRRRTPSVENLKLISQKTGISMDKLAQDYEMMLTPYRWWRKLAPGSSVEKIEILSKRILAATVLNGSKKQQICWACGRTRRIARNKHERALCPKCLAYWRDICATAQNITSRLIAQRVIPNLWKQKCVDCGNKAVFYDHRDYRKPEMVEPVCLSCNCLRGPAEPFRSMTIKISNGHPGSKNGAPAPRPGDAGGHRERPAARRARKAVP
jgi:transcriptional regulator with XRE-family HTH domain